MRLNNVLGQMLLVGLAAAAVFSCGSGDDSSSGGAGTSGVGGSGTPHGGSAGASAGQGGSAGTAVAGSGGATNGGRGGSGGMTTGGSSATNAGAPGESAGAAGESPVASVACDQCVAALATNPDYPACAYGCAKGDSELSSDADVTTCEGILDCVRQTQCASAGAADGTACFCGNVSSATCFSGLTADPNNPPMGECASKIGQALPVGSPPVAYGLAYFDTTSPIGAAISRAECELNFCAKECGLATGAAGASGQ
jgi:hypothetical protein